MKIHSFHKSILLNENELEKKIGKCIFCGSDTLKDILKIQENPNVNLVKCTKCSAISASRLPKKEVLDNYYNQYFDNYRENIGYTFENPARFGKYLVKKIKPFLNKEKSAINLMDFGGGNGTLAYELAKQLLTKYNYSVNIYVIDYFPNPVKSEHEKISVYSFNSMNSVKDLKFDIIIARAIIEHIANPNKELNSFSKLLDKNGILYINTPYVTPFLKILRFFGMKYDFSYPGHLHDLGANFWKNYYRRFHFNSNIDILKSKPAIVQADIKMSPFRAVLTHLVKAPWYVCKNLYHFYGGWEVFIQKRTLETIT